jgi:hypothetical protein
LRSEVVRLVRHPASSDGVAGISARIGRVAGSLKVVFSLEGDLDQLVLPPPVSVRRGDKLWQHTCFEMFVSARLPAYREFNFSPSGEWATYAFRGYREAVDGDPGPVRSLAIRLSKAAPQLELEAVLPMAGRERLAVGVSAVMESKSGALSYWALRHPPGKPDFHHPEAFALALDEVRD